MISREQWLKGHRRRWRTEAYRHVKWLEEEIERLQASRDELPDADRNWVEKQIGEYKTAIKQTKQKDRQQVARLKRNGVIEKAIWP
jgi:hypothetical protein